MFSASKPDDPDVQKIISKSQLEKKHGGNAPNVTRFWPPTMPEYVDFDPSESKEHQIIPIEEYNQFYNNEGQNANLVVMPREYRTDLEPLPNDSHGEIYITPVKRKQKEERKKTIIIQRNLTP